MAERLLIVTDGVVKDAVLELPDGYRTLVADAREVRVVVPLQGSWSDSQRRADEVVARLGSLRPKPSAEVGSHDPFVAVGETFARFPADMVLLVLRDSVLATKPGRTVADRVRQGLAVPVWVLAVDDEGRIVPGQTVPGQPLNVRAW